MKIRIVLVCVAVGILALSATAEAIEGVRAVRHIKLAVKEDCYSEARAHRARCLGWHVWHCYKLSRRKVRCHSLQEYRRNGNNRYCYFNTAAVERRDRSFVDLHFGPTRCYSEGGKLIP